MRGTLVSTNPVIMSIQYLQVFEVDRFRQRFTQSAEIFVWSSNTQVPAHPVLTMPSFIHPSHLRGICFVAYCLVFGTNVPWPGCVHCKKPEPA